MEWISKSYRLDTEVIGWLEELKDDYGSVNKGLRAMIAMGVDVETRERLGRFSGTEKRDSLAISSDLRSIPGVSVGLPAKKEVTGFPCRCIHSGCNGSRFTGMSRSENLCPDCFVAGHHGDPRNCSACADDSTSGAL